MYLERLLYGYKFARFFFSFSFFFAFIIYGKLLENKDYDIPELILFVYLITSFLLIFFKKISILEFLLDIVFLTGFILFYLKLTPYLSVLYLFPVFFYGVLTGSKRGYVLSSIAFLSVLSVEIFFENMELSSLFLVSFLSGFSLFTLTFAGIKLNDKIKKEEFLQSQLQRLKKEQEFYKKLYQISANVAHEIKNPLASISASAQLLKDGNLNPKLAQIIYEETKRIDDLIKEFLNLSKPFSKEKERINVYTEINKLIKNLSVLKDIDIKVFTKENNITIFMNKNAFHSLMSNIIKNAIEWANSKVIVSIEKIGNYLYISVEDDGIGVENNIKEDIFEPFFSTNPNGTGLGLSIAKNIVLNYKGDILVSKSEILGGAKFIIIIPLEVKNESLDSG